MKLILIFWLALEVTSAQSTEKEIRFQIQSPELTPQSGLYSNEPIVSNQEIPQTIYAPSFPHELNQIEIEFNPKPRPYPLTPPTLKLKIRLLANLGPESKTKDGSFISYIREGHLMVTKLGKSYHITTQFPDGGGMQRLKSGLNNFGRGFELSTLNAFMEKLFTCDEMTGILYELKMDLKMDRMIPIPWLIFQNEMEMDLEFKCKWATVKDNHLWTGSTGMGKDGFLVRKISPEGKITIVDWTKNFKKMAKTLRVDLDIGLVHHEAVAWSDILRKWIFTPRRISQNKVDLETLDKIGSNVMILADEEFNEIKTKELGDLMPMVGFTEVKLIPGTQDHLLLTIKAEKNERTNKFICSLAVYDLDGIEIMKPAIVPGFGVFTGVEFL